MKQGVWLVIATAFLAGCAAQAQPVPSGSYSNNTGSFNNNTCTAFGNGNTIVCNSNRSEFSTEVQNYFLQHMPDKTKPVTLKTIGGGKDQAIGDQVEKFLKDHGYRVPQRFTVGMQSPPPDYPFTLQVNGNQYQVQVAPSAH